MSYETAFKGLLWTVLFVLVFLTGYVMAMLTPSAQQLWELCTVLFDRLALLLTTE
ncbi:MAG: hypothetical protein NPIRA05_22100 [Nitrospirales bacterium]|nr:MAG: hypothetical protein NPIRA05_22100 [Nitrospirales bacterium]